MQAELTLKKSPLSAMIEKLAAIEPIGLPFVSVYLNAQADNTGQDNYRAWLNTELSNAGADYEQGSEQAESFKLDTERITEFLDNINPSANGVAIFSCGMMDFFETAQFDATIENNRFFAYDRPHIFPLARLVGQNPRFAVVWADTNKADIYVFGGQAATEVQTADDTAQVEEIQNVKTQRQQQGGWSQQRFQRRVTNFHQQHAKEVIEILEKLVRDEEIEMVVLSGNETGILQIIQDELPKTLIDKIIGTMNNDQYASENELKAAALEIVQKHDREQDREAVARMIGAKESSELGVTGVSATLAALSNGQVEELLILASPDRIRYNEENVEQVLEDYAPGDDNSLTDALPDTSEKRLILDELIVRAYNSSARIRFIEETSILSGVGGVGAILRYNITHHA